jgi:acyl-CoA dehydrogenase
VQDDEFAAVIDAVRDFIRAEVMPREAEIEQNDEVPEAIRAKAIAMGLFGYTLPEEYGGMDATVTQDVRLAMEFGYTSLAFRSMFGTNNGIAGQVLVNYGSPEQRDQWLPRLARGAVASFALTEAEAGSDPSGMRTRAVATGDGTYEITGSKRFITNAAIAELFMVFARTADAPEPGSTAGISCFLVEGGSAGLTVGPKDAKTGQAGAWTSELYFDRVTVPAASLVGGSEGAGFAAAMRSLSKGRLHIAGLCVGAAQRLLDESVSYAASNRQGGRPIGEFQLVQAMLAEMRTGLDAGRALVLDAARRFDSGEDR